MCRSFPGRRARAAGGSAVAVLALLLLVAVAHGALLLHLYTALVRAGAHRLMQAGVQACCVCSSMPAAARWRSCTGLIETLLMADGNRFFVREAARG